MKLSLVTSEYEGQLVSFDEGAWFNATEAAAHFGKRVDHFLANDETKAYIAALCESDNTRNHGYYSKTKRGRNGGTWFHPELAVFFARWLDVRFSIWCDRQIRAIISGNHPHYNWKRSRHSVSSSNRFMAESLKGQRESEGKETLPHHYINESKMINFILTGKYTPVDRDLLSDADLAMLTKLEMENSVLIRLGFSLRLRKEMLQQYVAAQACPAIASHDHLLIEETA